MSVQAFKLGAAAQDSLDKVVIMCASVSGTNNYMTLEYPVGTDYQVTSGYTLYITKIDVKANTTSNPCQIMIGYGDDGVADGDSAPTNWVQLTAKYTVIGASNTIPFDVIIPIPSGKYPCVLTTTNDTEINCYGIEVANS